MEKNKLSDKSLGEKKATIIYERIKSTYDLTGEELGQRLAGVGKQAIYKRKKKGNYDPDEIIRAFPDINRDWVRSDNLEKLLKLDVRSPQIGDAKVQYADSVEIPKNGLSDQAKRELFEQIELMLKILKESL